MMKLTLLALTPVAIASPVWAMTYLSVEQAQTAIFPGEAMHPQPVDLSPQQVAAIKAAAGVQPLSRQVKAWRTTSGGWFIVDEVVGKHEFITYAAGIDRSGAVKGIEILDYKETYGGQVRDPRWRQQFVGKTAAQPPRLGENVKNISGATLSSKHVTDGVRRLLDTWQIALAHA